MKKLKLLAVVFAGLSFAVASCKKGDTGPAGAKGAAGPAGPDSVYHSAWIQLSMDTLGTQTNSNGSIDTVYGQSITASIITQKIIDSGVVLSYIQNLFTNDGSIVDVSNYGGGYLDVAYNVGTINITSFFGDLSGASFRYVVIPGSVLTTNSVLKGLTKDQLKAIDYSTLTKALNLSSSKASNN